MAEASTQQQSTMPFMGFARTPLGTASIIVATISVIDVVWASLGGFSFQQTTLIYLVISAICLIATMPMLHPGPLLTMAHGYVLLALGWPALRVFNHLTFSISGPFLDDLAANADSALNLSWIGYAIWLNDNPTVVATLQAFYGSLTPLSIVGFIVIAFFGSRHAAEEFLILFVLPAASVSLFGVFLPAYGPMIHFSSITSQLDTIREFGWLHWPHYEALRSPGPHKLVLEQLPGLTTFPSFHTAMGLLLVYAMRERWYLLIPATFYSTVMIAGTPLFGSHYFVDLIAGAMLTAGAILLVRRWWPRPPPTHRRSDGLS
jgi:membrane-associated phospholipid phosphatase